MKKGVKKKLGAKRKASKKKKKIVRKIKKRVIKRKEKKVVKLKGKVAKKTSIPAGASLEEIGTITHYFPRVEAAVVKLTKGSLSIGNRIIIKGHTTDFKEKVNSLQLDHLPIASASPGQEIGIKVKSKVREHDVVYKLL